MWRLDVDEREVGKVRAQVVQLYSQFNNISPSLVD
jgi:hypothetical protein